MTELFSLGKLYPSDFLKPDEQPRCEPVELKLVMEDNGLVHLEKTAPPECMYGERYWYRSGINFSMRNELKDIVDSILKVYKVKPGQIFLDLASNDGTLLFYAPQEMILVGIDPVGGSIKEEAEKHSDLIIQDYFSEYVFKKSKYGDKKISVATIISMFYDISHPQIFLHELNAIMEDDALLVIQLSYTPLMLAQLEFSNLCHEHIFYYSLFNIKPLLETTGFKIMDVSLNNTNAGSFRIYAMKMNGDENKFGSQTHRDVCKFRIESLLAYEKTLKLDSVSTWHHFYTRICELKYQVVSFLKEETEKGKVVYGYGASTKGATMLGFFGINQNYLRGIADRSPHKYGLRTCGTDLPIISEKEMREEHPDYLFIMPFHFLSEFMERERAYLLKGGKFIVPLPTFRIITKDDL